MPRSLHRTWLALAVASLAVLVVAVFVGGDFFRDVFPECPGTIELRSDRYPETDRLERVTLDGTTAPGGPPTLHVVYDEKASKTPYSTRRYEHVRLERHDLSSAPGATPCTCGAIRLPWVERTYGASPSDVEVFRDPSSGFYVIKASRHTRGFTGAGDVLATFRLTHEPTRHLQTPRIFARHHLPSLVTLLAAGALGIALLRSRRAMSYALRIHTWTEARLTPEGMITTEAGATLGMLESGGSGGRYVRPGPVLVAPEGLSSSGLYRDMPIISRRDVAVGTHATWASGTMVRLRDARALAVISAVCTALAFGARLLA